MDASRGEGIKPSSLFRSRVKEAGKASAVDAWLLRLLLKGVGSPRIRSRLWDGSEVSDSGCGPVGMTINNRSTLLRLLVNPLLHFGDDYSAGNIEIQGGLLPFLEQVLHAMAHPGQVRRQYRSFEGLRLAGMHSLPQARKNIYHHYDLGNDFYRLWLDREMLYTCAFFPSPGASIEQAQLAKMELICRKIGLKPGDRVVEAGCGWGGLARYMARKYGARVSAYNISREQIAYARQRARTEGIEGVEYVEDDYRNIGQKCDAFVSIGMLEHVGAPYYHELGKVVDRVLDDRGIGLIHSIGQNVAEPMSPWMEKRIFPGAYPPTVREMMQIFEPHGFAVLDLENLRLHYAKTVEHWLERFEQESATICRMFDESFVRAWRLYLCSSIASFRVGSLQLFQVVFARPGNNEVPWTRDHLRVEGVNDATL